MIKVNLLSTKKKKKQKPVPAFLIYAVLLTATIGAIFLYITYHFSSAVSAKEAKVQENAKTIAALKEKIKAVEDFEKLNKTFQQRKDIIEELGETRPVRPRYLTRSARFCLQEFGWSAPILKGWTYHFPVSPSQILMLSIMSII